MIASFFAERMPSDNAIQQLLLERLHPKRIRDVTSYYRSDRVEVDIIFDEEEGITREAIERVLKAIGFTLVREMAVKVS